MSSDRDVTRIVRSWLDEGATQLPDRVLDAVLDQVPTTPQRRAWWPAWRFPLMNNTTVRFGIVAAAVVLAVVLGANYLWGRSVGGGPEATPTPTAAVNATELQVPGNLQPLSAGTYTLKSFPVSITFAVPADWVNCSPSIHEQGVCHETSPIGVAFLIVTNVVADPCSASGMGLDPAVGPSVDDLVTAISSLQGFEASAPQDITMDGFNGKQFTITAPAAPAAGCALNTWKTAFRTNGVGNGEINQLRILDVNGTRLLISGASNQGGPDSIIAIEQVMDSVRIQR